MKRNTAISLVCIFTCMLSCSKTVEEGISVRIENNTTFPFKEVLFSNQQYNNVDVNALSAYKQFQHLPDQPAAIIINYDNDTIVANNGRLYYDYVGYLEKGKYHLKIFEDTSVFSGFNCVYIKE